VFDISCLEDTDEDGIPNTQDIDADNDGIEDESERDCLTGITFTSDQTGGSNATINGIMPGVFDTVGVTIAASGGMVLFDRSTGSNNFNIEERPVVSGATLTMTFDQPIDDFGLSFDGLNIPEIGNFIITYQSGAQTTNALPIILETPIAGSTNTDVIALGVSGGINFFAGLNNVNPQASGLITFAENDNVTAISFAYQNTVGGSSLSLRVGASGKLTLDSDNDGIPNDLDLDSDNDGIADIIEAGGVDVNGDGLVDGVFTDTDGDGWSNVFDSDNGGTALSNPDTDGDGLNDFYDIDADGDGIVDVIESQVSGAINTPGGNDNDNDGVDDNFDIDNGNILTTPINTDGTDNPDYTDTDSDNDQDSDSFEAYDTDNDGAVNTLASGADSDGDGLDDNYDNIVGPNTTTNVTNGGQTSATFPNLDNSATTEPDWREINDSDLDGIADNIDLDDDNDGILDTAENDCVEDLSYSSNQTGGTNATINGLMAGLMDTANVTIVASNSLILNDRTTGSTTISIQNQAVRGHDSDIGSVIWN